MMQGECGDSGRQRGSVESSVERPTSVPCGHLLISCAMKLGSLFDPSLLFVLSLSKYLVYSPVCSHLWILA